MVVRARARVLTPTAKAWHTGVDLEWKRWMGVEVESVDLSGCNLPKMFCTTYTYFSEVRDFFRGRGGGMTCAGRGMSPGYAGAVS